MEILPSTTATTITTQFFGVVADNIAPVLALLGIMLGVGFVVRRLGAAKKGRV